MHFIVRHPVAQQSKQILQHSTLHVQVLSQVLKSHKNVFYKNADSSATLLEKQHLGKWPRGFKQHRNLMLTLEFLLAKFVLLTVQKKWECSFLSLSLKFFWYWNWTSEPLYHPLKLFLRVRTWRWFQLQAIVRKNKRSV